MYAGVFIGNYAKNMAFKEHNSGMNMSDRVIENRGYKILWDFIIQCDTKIEARWGDIVVIDKTKKEDKIIDVTIPGDEGGHEREVEKIEKYKVLQSDIARMWGMK